MAGNSSREVVSISTYAEPLFVDDDDGMVVIISIQDLALIPALALRAGHDGATVVVILLFSTAQLLR
jgi:hypothetical protein